MPFVKQITLFLNISIPFYFFYYQLYNTYTINQQQKQQYQDFQNQQQHYHQQQINWLYQILIASIVFISPILHILALTHPSYCYKGHCQTPKHCKIQEQQIQQKFNSNPYNKLLNKPSQFNTKDYFNQNIVDSPQQNYKFYLQQRQKQNDDKIKQSNTSSKDQGVPKYDNLFLQQSGSSNYIHNKHSNSFIRLQKIQSPSPLDCKYMKQQKQQQIFGKKHQQNVNINQFSNIPFFRPSRASLSNIGNNDSPRISRKSASQPNSILIEPLIKLTPRKQKPEQQIYYKKQLSSSLSSQNTQYLPQLNIQCEYCEQCHIPKYLRMKHCYRCSKCVHKYDHHCVLLNICIGQTNQKFYITFLYAHLYNTIFLLRYLLTIIKNDVSIDEVTGIQKLQNFYTLKAFAIIVFLLNLVLTIYLVFIHTKFFFNGSTTFQKERRQSINYFKHIKKNHFSFQALREFDKQQLQSYHPFNEGCLTNAWKLLTASKKPYDWQLPFKQCTSTIQLKQKKQHVKYQPQQKNGYIRGFEARQWGQQSVSSSHIQAGKTTKSRQSARKSKQQQQKVFTPKT